MLASEGASFAYCDASLFGAQSGVQRSLAFDPVTLARVNFVNGCALTRRADYIAIGGYDQELETVGFEDWDFWLRMVGNGRRGAYLPKPLLHWRRHQTGSRNPTTDPEVARAAAIVRKRNAGVVERLSSVRGRRLARRLAVHPRVVKLGDRPAGGRAPALARGYLPRMSRRSARRTATRPPSSNG